jgi:hypothetical protein
MNMSPCLSKEETFNEHINRVRASLLLEVNDELNIKRKEGITCINSKTQKEMELEHEKFIVFLQQETYHGQGNKIRRGTGIGFNEIKFFSPAKPGTQSKKNSEHAYKIHVCKLAPRKTVSTKKINYFYKTVLKRSESGNNFSETCEKVYFTTETRFNSPKNISIPNEEIEIDYELVESGFEYLQDLSSKLKLKPKLNKSKIRKEKSKTSIFKKNSNGDLSPIRYDKKRKSSPEKKLIIKSLDDFKMFHDMRKISRIKIVNNDDIEKLVEENGVLQNIQLIKMNSIINTPLKSQFKAQIEESNPNSVNSRVSQNSNHSIITESSIFSLNQCTPISSYESKSPNQGTFLFTEEVLLKEQKEKMSSDWKNIRGKRENRKSLFSNTNSPEKQRLSIPVVREERKNRKYTREFSICSNYTNQSLVSVNELS